MDGKSSVPEKYWAYVGIDPGQTGGVGVLAENSHIITHEWKDEHEARGFLFAINQTYAIRAVALEDVFACKGQSAMGALSFGKNVGYWRGLIHGMNLPLLEVKPQVWMKSMGVPNRKKGEPKTYKTSFPVAELMFPTVELRTPKGRKKDGIADALLIAAWARKEMPPINTLNDFARGIFG